MDQCRIAWAYRQLNSDVAETEISVSDARSDLAEIINLVKYGNQRFIITRRGRPLAALISIEDYDKLEQL